MSYPARVALAGNRTRPLSPRTAEAHARTASVQIHTVHISRVIHIAKTPAGGPRVMV